MRVLTRQYKPFPAVPQGVFTALIRAIIGQQISNKSARTIRDRLALHVGLAAPRLALCETEVLRGCGLSPRKAGTIQMVARLESEGAFSQLANIPDNEVMKALTALPGVGPWTAEMVLLFGLHRPDVWPRSDHGLMAAAASLYAVDSPAGLATLGDRFSPYRSHAAWYLWRTLGND